MTRFLRATRSVALTLAFVAAIVAPALSLDRVQWLYSMNPPSSWMTMQERQTRLGVGQWFFNALGSGNGYFSNLSVTPATGLNVTVGPTSVNTLASLYQYLPDDTNPFGGPGATALPVDNTQITVQGLMNGAQAQTLGPLNPPGTSGQSIIYAIECKVNTVDTTSQTVNFVSSSGVVTSGSANRDRADQIFCQSKAGTAGVSPVAPTIDTGYLGVANITVAFGAASITTGNISTTTANQFFGFARLNSDGGRTFTPTGTATASNNFGSGLLQFQQSIWNAGAPQTNTWAVSMDNTAFGALLFSYNGTQLASLSNTGFLGSIAIHAVAAGAGANTNACAVGAVCSSTATNQGILFLGTNSSFCQIDYGQTVSRLATSSCGLALPVLNQTAANKFGERVALSSGTVTFTFPAAYSNTPICEATGEGAGSNVLHVTPSTTSCIVTSSSGSDTQTVDIVVIGNPN